MREDLDRDGMNIFYFSVLSPLLLRNMIGLKNCSSRVSSKLSCLVVGMRFSLQSR